MENHPSPHDLFHEYMDKAKEVATRLCFHYSISGALSVKDDAICEAHKALWLRCKRFDPKKQRLQWQAEQQRRDQAVWAIIMGNEIPEAPEYRPYSNFWIASVQYVRGSVLDFFRSQKLITKRVKGDDTPTMLYAEKFVSLDRPLADSTNGSYGNNGSVQRGESFGDMMASSSRTDGDDESRGRKTQISNIIARSGLSRREKRVIDLLYDENGYANSEVGKIMRISAEAVKLLSDRAIIKMRLSAANMEKSPILRARIRRGPLASCRQALPSGKTRQASR